MKKILVLLYVSLAASPFAHADNRLFPTDILSKGEVDARINFEHQDYSLNFTGNGHPGRESLDMNFESIRVQYGLGSDWHMGASLNDKSKSDFHTDYSNPPAHFVSTSGEGRQNPNLWLKYGIINDTSSPYSLSGQMSISPNTTGRASSLTGDIAAGWESSDTLKYYADTSFSTSRDPNASNIDAVGIGAYKSIAGDITLIPHMHITRFQGTSSLTPVNQYGAGFSAQIQIYKDSYFIPDFSLYRNSSSDSKNGVFHHDAMTNGRAIRLALYKLF